MKVELQDKELENNLKNATLEEIMEIEKVIIATNQDFIKLNKFRQRILNITKKSLIIIFTMLLLTKSDVGINKELFLKTILVIIETIFVSKIDKREQLLLKEILIETDIVNLSRLILESYKEALEAKEYTEVELKEKLLKLKDGLEM